MRGDPALANEEARKSKSRVRILYLLCALLALHPVFIWMARRAVDGSDEPWGLFALCGAIVVVTRSARQEELVENPNFWSFPSVLLLYIVSLWWFSPLPRALIAMTALALLCMSLFQRNRFNLGLVVLFWLSLPLMASLQFYGGYPLRVLVAELAGHLLRLSGEPVTRVGVHLQQGGHVVSVDAACSGLKMLWSGGVATALLVSWFSLPPLRALAALTSAAAILIVANVFRAAALFQWEVRHEQWMHLPLAHLVHSAIGLVLFAFAVMGIHQSTRFFQGARTCSNA